ncbi:MAG: DNA polymerase III subunit delta [Erysipelotrichaceae bacterium]|nr:DNA polymerase III subunit delta [Erysipelotrichaceae bacterium]
MNYVVVGEDRFLVHKEVEKIKKLTNQGNELSTSFYDLQQQSIVEMIDDANMPSFLAGTKVIIAVNPLFLTANGKLEDAHTELLLQYLEHPNPDTAILFVLYQPLDQRKSIVKTMKKLCDFHLIKDVNANDFRTQVLHDCKQNQLKMSDRVKEELLLRLPLDYENWAQQIEKLKNYPGEITMEVLKSLVAKPLFGTQDQDALLFTNAILAKDMNQVFSMWHDLCITYKEPYSLIGLIASQFRFLYQVKRLQEKHYLTKDIASYLNTKEYRVTKTMEILRKYQLMDILEILNLLSQLDLKIKSGMIDAKNGFELFLLQATRRNRVWNR